MHGRTYHEKEVLAYNNSSSDEKGPQQNPTIQKEFESESMTRYKVVASIVTQDDK